jgi:hypothetical protein
LRSFVDGLRLLKPSTGRQWTSDLFDWLEQWLLSDPSQQSVREKLLSDLTVELAAMPENGRTARLERWLAETFREQPAFLRGCLGGIV